MSYDGSCGGFGSDFALLIISLIIIGCSCWGDGFGY
ncbi:sporulation protein YjcZ [Bacillus albus]|nr:sporulation protein YjcZ [Bacillus albus]MBU5220579.1 sporulation protein YjcZ [Bacillus albus]